MFVTQILKVSQARSRVTAGFLITSVHVTARSLTLRVVFLGWNINILLEALDCKWRYVTVFKVHCAGFLMFQP